MINIEQIIVMVLLAMLVVITIAIIRVRNLFGVAMLSGIFSLLMATVFTVLDAVDVAFTEAAVGAGVSTVLILSTLALINNRLEKIPERIRLIPLLVAVMTGAALIWAVEGLPEVGGAAGPHQEHTGQYYIEKTPEEVDTPNIVTAVLASYRGYDTMGEVAVIFTAGIGVMMLLGGTGGLSISVHRRRRKDKSEDIR